MQLSIVSPVFNAEEILEELVSLIKHNCETNNLSFEIILIDDFSQDNSWIKINTISKNVKELKGIKLSKNFGQHAAITAGISKSKGDTVIIMDCDLQDNPKYISTLYNESKKGNNIVCTIKDSKKHSLYRRISSKLFFLLVNIFSEVTLEKNLGTMTLIDRKVANEFLKVKDYIRHSSIIIKSLGFKRSFINVVHDERKKGKSSYSLKKLISQATNGIISNSKILLNISIYIGLVFILLSFIISTTIVVLSFYYSFSKGWPSTIILILFSTGLLTFTLGIHGYYIGNIYDQSKEKPIFTIEDEINFN